MSFRITSKLAGKLTSTALAAVFVATGASAQEATPLTYSLSSKGAVTEGDAAGFSAIFGAPSAVPSPRKFGAVGITFAENQRTGNPDADLGLSYAIGDPITGVNLTFGLAITSLRDKFGDAGSFSLSLARLVHAGAKSATFVGANVANIGEWGDLKGDPRSSIYITQTGVFGASEDRSYIATIGYGQEAKARRGKSKEDGFFWGFGVGMTPNLSASLSGSETQVNFGVSALIKNVPGLVVTLGVNDVFDNTNQYQPALTIGYGFKFGG